ncbi:type II toxin-antitoxin system tRNA(fMet)-specific endonuclease VapC [Shewanella algae]|uniref:type II toxin-antitoxin system tRNA(fMet)-specific endonuclease VapC n=1 Tax=Shewanella algae TaxID=38313 RepID=UPI0031F5AF1A
MLKFLLDTNICIFTIKNKPHYMRTKFEQYQGQICISSVCMMELIYGAEKSARADDNLRVVEGFCARLEVLPYDAQAAAHTGQIRAELAKAGTRIGPYDEMIAGHARGLGLTLVTNNTREFKRVSGLRVIDWV